MDDDVFLAHLNKYPALRRRMEEILNVASVPYTAARQITETHASVIQLKKDFYTSKCQDADIIIAESDGSMIPIVETLVDSAEDRRKNKRLHWREARLSLAHAKDCVTPYFAATLESVSEAGENPSPDASRRPLCVTGT